MFVKVKHSEQGTLLFEAEGKLFHYTACHFGAKFSAYWWSRLGALITRIAHELLAPFPHRMWLYVDDLLALLQDQECTQPVCLLLSLLACTNAPVSLKKAQLGSDITWCGWTFSFKLETIHLWQSKLAKLRAQLRALHSSRKVHRKLLEANPGAPDVGRQHMSTSPSLHGAVVSRPAQRSRNAEPYPPADVAAFLGWTG